MRLRLYISLVGVSWIGVPCSLANPVEYIRAIRSIEARTIFDTVAERQGLGLGVFDSSVSIDAEGWGLIATATQKSSITPWSVDVLVDSSADTSYVSGFPEIGTGRSEFELQFEVIEPVGYRVSGLISGYDGFGAASLSGVFSASERTNFPDPENPWDTTPGVSRLNHSGVLPPASYTLRSSSEASPLLGGWGGADANFTLEFVTLSLAGWLEKHGLPADEDLSSDFDSDGVSLIEEAAFLTDPTVADSQLARPDFDFDQATRVATLSYPLERTDLEYNVEWSSDLRTWEETGITKEHIGLTTHAHLSVPAGRKQLAMRLRLKPVQ